MRVCALPFGRFNTQPPEGGWSGVLCMKKVIWSFNTQPPEGGWAVLKAVLEMDVVSTHSRPKAAGFWSFRAGRTRRVSTHSRPKAAGGYKLLTGLGQKVSTHSRPKAAGQAENQAKPLTEVSTHSRPKAAGAAIPTPPAPEKFQHTAARRRLGLHPQFAHLLYWFQHTAARRRLVACV